ncbi:unnamed protein product [Chrysoparadoxa australica]
MSASLGPRLQRAAACSFRRRPLVHRFKIRSSSSGSDTQGGETGDATPITDFRQYLNFKKLNSSDKISSDSFEGKAVLVVNTASLCGFTPQLGEMQAVHNRFGRSGLTVLAVPSNDFGEQEPWGEEEIREFYEVQWGVTYPITSKVQVIGDAAHPFYKAIASTVPEDFLPVWNFGKYLLNHEGDLVGVFPSSISPCEEEVTEAILEALPAGEVWQGTEQSEDGPSQ